MRHLIFYLTVSVIAVFMVVIIRHDAPKPTDRILTVRTDHSYLYDPAYPVEIMVYVNHDHPILHAKPDQLISYLHNEDESKKIELILSKIRHSHDETYLNERFMSYQFIYQMPTLIGDFIIEDAYVTLIDESEVITLPIGRFSVTYLADSSDDLTWTTLSGIKMSNDFLSRIHVIDIGYQSLDQAISKIEISPFSEASFEVLPEVIRVTIEREDILLFQLPIIITFEDGSMQAIPNFRYLIDYSVLKESGMLIYHYGSD